uniref:Putative ovule protein n=2 Tax=Solanum chacoense TaxID=4108 RepID=A0A0V0GSP3_SOLCH
MAFLFGRALLGASTTQIRGYCQKVSSTAELDRSFRRTSIMFGAGAVTFCNILYFTVHTKLNEIRERERERDKQWNWDTRY